LFEETKRAADVSEGARPTSAVITDTTIFQIGRSYVLGGESSTEVSRMCKIVLRAPVSAVNIDKKRMRTLVLG